MLHSPYAMRSGLLQSVVPFLGADASNMAMCAQVQTDNRMRSWSPDGRTGLLYRCSLGSVDLNAPIGALALPSLAAEGVRLWGFVLNVE